MNKVEMIKRYTTISQACNAQKVIITVRVLEQLINAEHFKMARDEIKSIFPSVLDENIDIFIEASGDEMNHELQLVFDIIRDVEKTPILHGYIHLC